MVTYLVGWDGSEAAELALTCAVRLVQERDRLIVAFVVPARLQEQAVLEIMFPTVDLGELVETGTVVAQAKSKLKERAEEIDTTASVETAVRVGDPADELTGIIEDEAVDHLVLGFKSYERYLRFGLGSNAEKLVLYAPCTVTIAR